MGLWKRILRIFIRVKVEKTLVFRCPICSPVQFIEHTEWIQHLVDSHRRETLEREFPDADLIYYLAGKNPTYGRPLPEEIRDDEMRSRVGSRLHSKEMDRQT